MIDALEINILYSLTQCRIGFTNFGVASWIEENRLHPDVWQSEIIKKIRLMIEEGLIFEKQSRSGNTTLFLNEAGKTRLKNVQSMIKNLRLIIDS